MSATIERRRVEGEIRHQALHDPLTALPNRTLLHDRLEQALAHTERSGEHVAVLFIDLDEFKVINDSLGHDAGDRLLTGVVPRLLNVLRPQDTLARFAGDEFVAVCEGLDGRPAAESVARRLLDTFDTRPFEIAGRRLQVSASLGIAVSGPELLTPESLLRSADAAMYRAKRQGRGRHEVFGEHLQGLAADRLDLDIALRQALGRDQLRLAYQPIVSLPDRRIVAVEALLRWQHPVRGRIPPDVFIPAAEENGLILPIGAWVLRQACEQLVRWRATGAADDLTVFVNLSARQFRDPTLATLIADILATTGVPAAQLGMELTESHLQDNPKTALDTLQTLKKLGVRLAMDDFGTGFSSLGELKRMPIDVLKIDRGFVEGLGAEPYDSAITTAIVAMAKALDVAVTAEGVETAAQLDELVELGCDRAQGYYFDQPLTPDQLLARLM